MNPRVTDSPAPTEALKIQERQIKEHLQTVLPAEVYEKWIEHFVFEKISRKKIVIGYYGSEPLKEFTKQYEELVWIQVCAVIGYSKKMKIRKRKAKTEKAKSAKTAKNLAVAKWLVLSLFFVCITLMTAVLAGNYLINRNFKETFYSVSSLRANNQIRVIQISDLHESVYGDDNSKLTDRVAKLKPDIILFTGDCLDSVAASVRPLVSLCAKLTETAPVYYIYGNNEAERYYDVPLTQEALDKKFGFRDDTRDAAALLSLSDELEKALEGVGVTVLKNRAASLSVGATKVDIYGVLTSNPSSFWSYAGESFNDYLASGANNLKLTVMHEPLVLEIFTPETSWGDLIVCGHTHGGFTRLPRLGGIYTHEGGLLPERRGHYVYGRYDVAGSPLIVSSGLENHNLFRLNNRPELVIIDINKF